MLPLIGNPLQQTLIVVGFLLGLTLLTLRRNLGTELLLLKHTNTLKGLAILVVMSNHVGNYLLTPSTFLSPFANFAGVAVDVFLLLSGYGLTVSWMKKRQSVWLFYWKRWSRIFVPLWLSLLIVLTLDYVVHHLTYSISTVASYAAGIVPNADIYGTLNSPLWFITLLVSYYLLFPWAFRFFHPKIASLLLVAAGYGLIFHVAYPVQDRVTELLQTHWLAFPAGTLLAAWLQTSRLRNMFEKKLSSNFFRAASVLVVSLLVWMTYVLTTQQTTPLSVQFYTLLVAIFFSLLVSIIPFSSLFLEMVGLYAYEIYLLHWPLLLRHDPLYVFLPSGIATSVSFALLLGIAYLLSWTVRQILNTRPSKKNFKHLYK